MGKIKSAIITATAVLCTFLTGTTTSAGNFLKEAAYFSAGMFAAPQTSAEDNGGDSSETHEPAESSGNESSESAPANEQSGVVSSDYSASADSPAELTDSETSEAPDTSADEPQESEPAPRGRIITLNRADGHDDTDFSAFTDTGGVIYRRNFGRSNAPDTITLSSGAQLRNCTDEANAALAAFCETLPDLGGFESFAPGSPEPQVLIYHTHTSESFLPYGDSFDRDYPTRSEDPARNIIAVGDAICEALAQRGISVVHDCRVHDRPLFTGAYYRSADTMLADLETYPGIKLAIDIHRDGIENADGSVTAPVAEINGKTAAQFMIITGCDSEEAPIPEYRTSLKAACLIQNCAEKKYPALARSILFDYRSYNQPLFAGNLLIEIGSQGNSLDEALYAGELLGDVLADAVLTLAEAFQ